MRIAVVTPEYISEENFDGGLANHLYRICKLLKERGHEPVIIVGSNENNLIEHEGIEVHRVNVIVRRTYVWKYIMYPWCDWIIQSYRLNKRLRYLQSQKKFDVVHYASYTATSLLRPKQIPAIVMVSGFLRLWNEAYELPKNFKNQICCRLEILGFKRADLLFGPGEMVGKVIEDVSGKPVHIVETPFVPYEGEIDTSIYDENLAGKRYLLFFGTIGLLKGTKTIADILPDFFEINKDFYFVFVGKTGSINNKSMVKYIFAKAGKFRDRVIHIRKLRHCSLQKVLEHAEAVVLPSRVDNFPNTCIEAMAAGKIVIGTQGASFEQLITDGKSGFLCGINDAKSLLSVINRVLALSPKQKKEISLNAMKRIESLSSGVVIDQLIALYRQVIDTKNGRKYEMELRPSMSEKIDNLMRKIAKKVLPKIVQIKLKNALYRFSKFRKVFRVKPISKVRQPFISVIVPVYNHSQYLRQALERTLEQSYRNFEVIAFDDCSSEPQVKEILDELQARYRNLRVYYNQTNMGISETLNRAIIASKGDYIAFLDCDDYLATEAIVTVALEIENNPEAGYFFSNRVDVDEHGKELDRVLYIHQREDNYLRKLLKGMFTDHLKIIAKKSFLEVGLLDTRYDFAQDYEFALRFAARKPQGFHHINEFLYYHRVYPGQVSKKYRQKQLQVAARIRDQIRRKAEIRSGRRNKKLSIVITSFYKREHTFRCIEAVKNTVHGDYEIILLDNGSDAVTVEAIKNKYTSDKLVRMFFSEVNLGCGGGRQMAISHATSDYIVTLDNDIVVTDTWIEEMIMRIEQNEDAGGVCAKVVFPDGKIQHNGGNMTIDGHFVEFGLIDAWKDSNKLSTMRERECDWIPGGATLFKREVYDRVKLCKDFVNSYEDNDFALNVRKLGYKLLNCPTAVVIHNHIYYDNKTANTEHEYLAARYCKDGLKQSVTAFYRRHGLIIKDQQKLVPELKAEAAAILSGE